MTEDLREMYGYSCTHLELVRYIFLRVKNISIKNCAEKWTPFNLVTWLNQRTYTHQTCHAVQIF